MNENDKNGEHLYYMIRCLKSKKALRTLRLRRKYPNMVKM